MVQYVPVAPLLTETLTPNRMRPSAALDADAIGEAVAAACDGATDGAVEESGDGLGLTGATIRLRNAPDPAANASAVSKSIAARRTYQAVLPANLAAGRAADPAAALSAMADGSKGRSARALAVTMRRRSSTSKLSSGGPDSLMTQILPKSGDRPRQARANSGR